MHKIKTIATLSFFIILFSSSYLWATPGSLDTTFGAGTGWVSTSFQQADFSSDSTQATIQQTDGKLVTAGTGVVAGQYGIILMRYFANGSLDTSFNGTGKVATVIVGTTGNIVESLIQQSDGKLVAVGYATVGNHVCFALVRYNPDGSPDTTFGGDGKIITDIGGTARAYSVIQQADGKLVVAGHSYTTTKSQRDTTLVRYNVDGSLDTSFDGDGIVITPIGPGQLAVPDDGARSVIQQADGKLVIAGYSYSIASATDFALARYNTDGSLDVGFGVGGIVTTDINTAYDDAYAVIQQTDGKLVAAGNSYIGSNRVFALVRYNIDGTLDTSFDSDGKVVTAIGLRQSVANSLIQQFDGKLVAAGFSVSDDSTYSRLALVRYNSDGGIDVAFDSDGIVTTRIGSTSRADSLIQQRDGKLVTAGLVNMPSGTEFVIARYQSGQFTKNDYNNDGIAGWIWKGDSNGVETQNQIWQLSFPLYSSNWGIPIRTYPAAYADQADWEIMTTGDFDGDGNTDIYWRKKDGLFEAFWRMVGGVRESQTVIINAGAQLNSVSGAGDTDKDGDDDIILNNVSTGEVWIWVMQLNRPVDGYSLGSKAGYVVNRIGDFDGDGDIDLLLKQVGGNALVIWEIENNALVSEKTFPSLQAGWDTVCAGDFDNDGDADIMLVNSTTQQERWFEMQNFTRIAQHFGSMSTGFVFLGCGDFDGDGDMDMLWQRSSDDMNRVVLQQNWGVTKQTVYTNPFGGVNPGAAGYGFKYRNNSN